ncbi:DUF2971 domain-containing protein [Vibrio vulnificus]|uniref:DUF2971 domain-containing protein n=1 Tax=Vibrio vulnificus TaxID=672 RepID=UPI0005F2500A|nr:DUF2971 domain-containing protein [Vibrio vulnificus]
MKVYKYRGGAFDRDLASLRDNQFYAPSRNKLNDPCEGVFDQKGIFDQTELISKLIPSDSNGVAYKSLVNSLKDVFSFVDKSGIYSLSKTPLEELLWAHYSYNHTGFCIEYDLDRLSDFIDRDCHRIPVTYKTCPPEVCLSDISNPQDLVTKMFGVKSSAWGYENELRLVTSQAGIHDYDFRAVTGIYFGLRMDEREKQQIMQTLKGRGIQYYQIVLKGNSYEFQYQNIPDAFIGSERYMYNIAPVADYAITPDYVNVKYKRYTPYLYKAAEIVRREPYCSRVEMAEFSSSKGNPSDPVIFVQYVNLDGGYKNHYLPVKEIDAAYDQLSDIEENAI